MKTSSNQTHAQEEEIYAGYQLICAKVAAAYTKNSKHYQEVDTHYERLITNLCLAAQSNNIEKLNQLATRFPLLHPDSLSRGGITALHFACASKSNEAAVWLIKHGANLFKAAFAPPYKKPIDFCDPALANELEQCFQEYNSIFLSSENNVADNVRIESEHPAIALLYRITGEKFNASGRMTTNGIIFDATMESRNGLRDFNLEGILADVGLPFVTISNGEMLAPGTKLQLVIIDLDEYLSLLKGYSLYGLTLTDEEIRQKEYKDQQESGLGPTTFHLGYSPEITKKYMEIGGSNGLYFYKPKLDIESQAFFARQKALLEESERRRKVLDQEENILFGKAFASLKLRLNG